MVVLSLWQWRYVYAPTVAGIDGMGVPDVDKVVVVREDVVVTSEDEAVTCTDEVLVKLWEAEEEVDEGDREYKFSP
jgi:hypothetical protein